MYAQQFPNIKLPQLATAGAVYQPKLDELECASQSVFLTGTVPGLGAFKKPSHVASLSIQTTNQHETLPVFVPLKTAPHLRDGDRTVFIVAGD